MDKKPTGGICAFASLIGCRLIYIIAAKRTQPNILNIYFLIVNSFNIKNEFNFPLLYHFTGRNILFLDLSVLLSLPPKEGATNAEV